MTINLENWGFDLLPTIFICILFPLFLYFSGWLFITGILGLCRMIKSKNWHWQIGEIIDAKIKFKEDSEEGFTFVMEKTYKYTVNENEFTSSQSLASDSIYSKEFKSIEDFPEKRGDYSTKFGYQDLERESKNAIGKQVTVYFDPNNPKIACLEPGINNRIFIPIFMGLFFGTGLSYIVWHFILSPIISYYHLSK